MRALQVVKGEQGRVVELGDGDFGDGVLIDVTHSSLNYKDALAIVAARR